MRSVTQGKRKVRAIGYLPPARRRLPVVLLVLVPLTLIVPVLQHLFTQVDLLMSGVVVHWGDADAVVGTFGFFRYIKEIFGLILIIVSAFTITTSRVGIVQRLRNQAGTYLGLALLIGLVGHILDPQPLLLAVGLRWMVHTTAAVGLCLIVLEYDLWSDLRFRRLLLVALCCALFGNTLFVLLQERVQAGYARYTGLFSNAGVMGFFVIGVALTIELVMRGSLVLCTAAYGAALYSAMRAGSRAAMIVVGILWITFLIRKVAGKNNMLLGLSLPLFFYGVWFSFNFAESTADRGNLIEAQLEQGGRISNIGAFAHTFQQVSIVDIIVGKGFGYGTNGAFGFSSGVNTGHPWLILIDNGYITWFVQFGVLGSLLLLFIIVGWCELFMSAIRAAPETRVIATSCMLTPLFLMMVGNGLEQFGLIFFLALGTSWVLSQRSGYNHAAAEPSTRHGVALRNPH